MLDSQSLNTEGLLDTGASVNVLPYVEKIPSFDNNKPQLAQISAPIVKPVLTQFQVAQV